MLLMLFIAFNVSATNRTKSVGEIKEGLYIATGGTSADTIVLSDTVSWTFQVSHAYSVWPDLSIYYQKIGAGNPTLKLDVYESPDGNVYSTVKKGKAQAAYTKSYSPTATGMLECSFEKDTAYFTKRYLKFKFSTGATSGTKAKLTNHFKTNIK